MMGEPLHRPVPGQAELELIAVRDAAVALALGTETVLAYLRRWRLPRYLRRIHVRPGVWTNRAYITPEVYAIVRRSYLSRMIPRDGPPLV